MAVAAGLASAGLVLAACSSGSTSSSGAAAGGANRSGAASVPAGPNATSPADPSTTSSTPARPRLSISRGAHAFDEPVRFGVADGTLVKASVRESGSGDLLAGDTPDPQHWTSSAVPRPGATYRVTATVADDGGSQSELRGTFTVDPVPDGNRLTLTMTPAKGQVVGIGAPITVQFDQDVTMKKEVQQAITVSSSKPVTGSWHWLGSRQVQFRPQKPWTTGTTVRAQLNLDGVQASKTVWGGRTYDLSFTIGTARTAVIDAAKHTFTVWENGARKAVWPTSLGKPEFATRNGRYIVLGKYPTLNMTSCSVGIACSPGDPNYYSLKVDWDVRITNSGTFIHSAPWSAGAQGSANVSHGCVNLSNDRGRAYFNSAKYGDMVTVRRSSRTYQDLVAAGDPGMYAWNQDWTKWVQGSATGASITTSPLTAGA